jgi:hypothetical protein
MMRLRRLFRAAVFWLLMHLVSMSGWIDFDDGDDL